MWDSSVWPQCHRPNQIMQPLQLYVRQLNLTSRVLLRVQQLDTSSAEPPSVSLQVTSVWFFSQQPSTPLSRPHVLNPLVRAGLVPVHLADILSPQAENVAEKWSCRITGVRVLTSNEYTEMMREKDRREKEAAEMKQKEKEEREQKRLEKEQETLTEVRTRVATRVLHTQSGLLIGTKTRVMLIVRQATQYTSSAMQGSPPFLQARCLGWLRPLRRVGTHTVLWVTTQLHVSSLVHHVVHELYFACCFYAAKVIFHLTVYTLWADSQHSSMLAVICAGTDYRYAELALIKHMSLSDCSLDMT